ncbi:MAG: 2-oxoacid:acceptor oxidoreductase family protein, partial [Bdellovibrionales bacterium]|nr:2-oxoacid:acceptor oxidoreductase family protein [Bdellovibrionales bacterium]
MSQKINDFSVSIATVNGSGSQSSNNILMRSIFKMGIPVGGKNMFPSNIAGLPTWFSIRVNDQGYISRETHSDIVVSMNKSTALEDIALLKEDGVFIYNTANKIEDQIPEGINAIGVDFNKLAAEVTKSIQLKKLLVNMIYVGVLSELMNIDEDVLFKTVEFQFKGKESVFKVNQDAIRVGREYARAELKDVKWSCKVEKRDLTSDKILIDGNTAGALGLLYGCCTFSAWYPITPSSSLAESFESFCEKFRVEDNKQKYAMVQAEDELSAISMVAGAGWAGSRAMTTTSGPGISLMAETIGLMYFAEIPGVIWDVQRMGPSTGLPTRTSQGDLMSAAFCSHGDTKHPVYLPGNPKECFEFGTES